MKRSYGGGGGGGGCQRGRRGRQEESLSLVASSLMQKKTLRALPHRSGCGWKDSQPLNLKDRDFLWKDSTPIVYLLCQNGAPKLGSGVDERHPALC